MTKEKYCCFLHPQKDYALKELADPCPDCGRPYGFVLTNPPEAIGQYKITGPLGRGFYGATYIAERGRLRVKCVIKITPVSFYPYFGKVSFEDECANHQRLAQGASHIVGINDYFDSDVIFTDTARTTLPCHVAELEYVDGVLLRDVLSGQHPASAKMVAQIAVDLLRVRGELESKHLYHNDLHAGNLVLERYTGDTRRTDAIDERIRLRAIDLGSVGDASKSNGDRAGDLQWIATHIEGLTDKMLRKPEHLNDRDYRIALALQSVIHSMTGEVENRRLPSPEDLVGVVTQEYQRATQPWRPWREGFSLRTFGAHYNAQTLHPWDAPHLFVDQGEWLQQVTKPGPQIVTGMRGCGKTLLLRSLEFHARAAVAQRLSDTATEVRQLLIRDGFVGLFASAQRLLDLKKGSLVQTEHRLTRLLLTYGLQAVRALSHLGDIDKEAVEPNAHLRLAEGIGAYLGTGDALAGVVSLPDLETRLERVAVRSHLEPGDHLVKAASAQLFPKLAAAIRSCSAVWNNATVLFLLDDVSTRYLEIDRIESLLSSLVFNDPICAFKLSSEWQTIELGLKSPARVHPIRIDRDVAVFDLGSEVNRVINASNGVEFVETVLLNRARHHAGHPAGMRPKDVLGNRSLIDLARTIAGSTRTAAARKEAYWGLTSLASVCVGDIGDVIKLYDKILVEGDDRTFPISASKQSDCFLSLSSQRLFELNRRGGYFKDAAKTFAEASHDLLVKSYRQEKKERLREYASIYVRVTADAPESREKQIDRLRELVDAGVFVFTGGSPRTKTKDSDPILQFKLTYRKIYGLTSLIGLADRDRFEVSGPDLERWLDHPEEGREILLRNLGGEETAEVSATTSTDVVQGIGQNGQGALELADRSTTIVPGGTVPVGTSELQFKPTEVQARELDLRELKQERISNVLIGLGFEARTLEVSRLLAGNVRADGVRAIRYGLAGYAEGILRAWSDAGVKLREIDYDPIVRFSEEAFEGLPLIDVSGLSKPLIFNAVRDALSTVSRVLIAYGRAATYYPTAEEIEGVMVARRTGDNYSALERLGEILRGEKGPYESVGLLPDESDQTRRRALIAFPSPKHERIFRLLDDRDFDEIHIVCSKSTSARAEISRLAAEVIAQTKANTELSMVDTNDLAAMIRHCDDVYLGMYANDGANVEVGLTGSKLQAVAISALSSRRKFSQAWYVKPREFDVKRFSDGFASLRVFELRLTPSE